MIKKQILFIPLILFGFAACSTNPDAVKSDLKAVKEKKTAQAKPRKHRHKKQTEGVISVDITNYNNRLYLLTGKHQLGQKTLWYQYSDDGGST